MRIKNYLRPRNFGIIAILVFAIVQNHLSARFQPSELCMLTEYIGEIPDECQGYTLTGPHLHPWEQAVIKELEKDSVSTQAVIARKDRNVLSVDVTLILLGLIAIQPKTKQQ